MGERKPIEVEVMPVSTVTPMQVYEDILRSRKAVYAAEMDMQQMQAAQENLRKKKRAWQRLSHAGRYNTAAMQISIKQMDVEMRKFLDAEEAAEKRKEHHEHIVEVLEKKLRQMA
jgi:hypothetical protein